MIKRLAFIAIHSLFVFAILYAHTARSQSQDLNFKQNAIMPAPPEASSINKGGDVSVNLSIGAPSVVIPIADVKSRFIGFNVSLNYSSNGTAVNALTPNTGLGWSLNCGGAVNRTTLGLPDEQRSLYNNGMTNYTIPNIYPMTRTVVNYLTGLRDRESDVFDFSVNGYINGKFILDENANPKQLSGKPYRISKISSSILDGFSITDDKGMVFLFTLTDTSYYDRGDCAADAGERVRPVYNTWHLTKIIKPSQDTVYFNYAVNNYKFLADVNQTESICITSGVGGCPGETPTTVCPLWVANYTSCKTIQTVNGHILSEVVFNNGNLRFEYTANRQDMTGGKAMKSITLLNNTDTLRYVRLVTDYSTRRGTGFDVQDTTLRYRLFLRELQIGGSKSRENEYRYQFAYQDEDLLPGRMSTLQDKYGLPNGAGPSGQYFLNNFQDEYPEINYYGLSPTAIHRFGNHAIDTNFIRAGLLSRIVYPTGGTDSIVYTPNMHKVQKLIPKFFDDWHEICPASSSGKGDTTYFHVAKKQYLRFTLFVTPQGSVPAVHDRAYSRLFVVGGTTPEKTFMTDYSLGYLEDSVEVMPGDYYVVDSMMRNNMCVERTLYFELAPDTLIVEEAMGGVSVASIISKDPVANNVQTRNYSYRDRVSNELRTFLVTEDQKFAYINIVKRFVNCEDFYDCVGLTFCSYLVNGGSQIRPISIIGGNYFYHNSVIESVSGDDNIDRSTEHIFDYNLPLYPRLDNGSPVNNTPYGIVPDYMIGEKRTTQFSRNRLTGEDRTVQSTAREFALTEHRLVENFNVAQIYESPCTGDPVSEVEKGSFNVMAYPVYYQQVDMVKSIDTLYSSDGNSYSINITNYEYTGEPYCLPRRTVTAGSKGEVLATRLRYIFDEPGNTMYTPMLNRNQLSLLSLTDSVSTTQARQQTVAYKYAEGNGNIVTDYKVDEQIGNGAVSNLSERTLFDNVGNVLEAKIRETPSVYVWGYRQTKLIAAVDGALYGDVAYTSFEELTENSWSNPSSSRNTTNAVTGKSSFDLSAAGGTGLTKAGLTASRSYIVSYWTQNSVSYSIAGTQGSVRKGATTNGWTYFEHTVSGVSGVTVSGSGLIDELRLYPAGASIKTFTYIPLLGLSSQSDEKGSITYYEYDQLGRLSVVRDMFGNILKKIDYKYQVPANN